MMKKTHRSEGKEANDITSNASNEFATDSINQSTEVRKEHLFDFARFEAYVTEKSEFIVKPLANLRQFKSGQSNPTFYFKVSHSIVSSLNDFFLL